VLQHVYTAENLEGAWDNLICLRHIGSGAQLFV
jgi:hypothetical protein